MNTPFLRIAFRGWLTEIVISGLNYFLLMGLLWKPLFGELRSHEIGMSTRIVYIYGLAYLLLRFNPGYTKRDLAHAGGLWLGSALVFEWLGSLLIQRRPVDEILIGWRVWDGYMWPYVLVAYASANYVVGSMLMRRRPLRADAAVGLRCQPGSCRLTEPRQDQRHNAVAAGTASAEVAAVEGIHRQGSECHREAEEHGQA